MSKIKDSGLDQYDAEPFEQQQFGTAGVEGVNRTWPEMTFLQSNVRQIRLNDKHGGYFLTTLFTVRESFDALPLEYATVYKDSRMGTDNL